jgi:hypothetical protein
MRQSRLDLRTSPERAGQSGHQAGPAPQHDAIQNDTWHCVWGLFCRNKDLQTQIDELSARLVELERVVLARVSYWGFEYDATPDLSAEQRRAVALARRRGFVVHSTTAGTRSVS